jgi:hypothetical protein
MSRPFSIDEWTFFDFLQYSIEGASESVNLFSRKNLLLPSPQGKIPYFQVSREVGAVEAYPRRGG